MLRLKLLIATVIVLIPVTAFGLVTFNDGSDQIFITGVATTGFDSNLDANKFSSGDTFFEENLELDYHRHVGLLGINADIGWTFEQFLKQVQDDFNNPHARIELTKDSGRATGGIKVSAERDTQADSAANIRTTSWNYDTELNVKYPVIERYYVTGRLNWSDQDYGHNTQLVSISNYEASGDLYYVYTSERDITAGYRYRVTDTTGSLKDYDQAFYLGTTGKLLAKLRGSFRIGYQIRQSDQPFLKRETFNGITGNLSATWAYSSKLNITATVNEDYSATATNQNVDTLSANIDAQYTLTAHWSVFGGVGAGHVHYLGVTGGNRADTYESFNAGVAYRLNDHLKVTTSYAYYHDSSTLLYSNYDRSTVSISVTSRW